MTIKPFEDLIKPIEIDGKTFVPIEEIAKLAFPNNKLKNKDIFILKSYFCAINFTKKGQSIQVGISENFSVRVYNHTWEWCDDCENQVQIVKNLIKWGFIEP